MHAFVHCLHALFGSAPPLPRAPWPSRWSLGRSCRVQVEVWMRAALCLPYTSRRATTQQGSGCWPGGAPTAEIVVGCGCGGCLVPGAGGLRDEGLDGQQGRQQQAWLTCASGMPSQPASAASPPPRVQWARPLNARSCCAHGLCRWAVPGLLRPGRDPHLLHLQMLGPANTQRERSPASRPAAARPTCG